MTGPVTQLEYRQLIEDCLDDLADLVDADIGQAADYAETRLRMSR